MAVWTGPHLYSQTQINHVVLSEVHVLQNNSLITVKGYIAGRMNHNVDSHSRCTFTVRINPDTTAREKRGSCRWQETCRRSQQGLQCWQQELMTLHHSGSVLELLEANVTTWLVVVAGHRHMGMFRVWIPCHPPTVMPQPPQGGWIYHLKFTRANAHNRTAPTSSLGWQGWGEMLSWAVFSYSLSSSQPRSHVAPLWKAAVASFPSVKPRAFRKHKRFLSALTLLNYCTDVCHVLITCQDALNNSG